MIEQTDILTFKNIENNEENLSKDNLSEDEKLIKNRKFFGDCEPCSGYSYPATFIRFDNDTASYTGNLLDFNHNITLRAVEATSKRKFNPQIIKTDGRKVYNVRYDGDFFVSCKNVNIEPKLFEEIKKIKRKLINFYRNKKDESPEITIVEFWEKYIDPLAAQYNEELRKTVSNDETEVIEDQEIPSIIEYLEDKYLDIIYSEYLSFLNKPEVTNKLTKEYVDFSSLNLCEIKNNITSSLSGIEEKLNVTYCADKIGSNDLSIKFKVEGRSESLDSFKDALTKIDESVKFTLIN